MASTSPELVAHREWLGQIGQVGLVVSPVVLVKHQVVIDRHRSVGVQTALAELVDDEENARVPDAFEFFRDVLGWRDERIAGLPGSSDLPDALISALPEHEDHLRPTCAVRDPERDGAWLLLVQVLDNDEFDRVPPPDKHHGGWRASPHARLERLLRDTGVPIGLLFNGRSLRLVYAPKGESSGHLTFHFRYLLETQGRLMAGALHALLADERISDLLPEAQRLPALLSESREYQNDVSTALADQVLEALWELVRGFQAANEASKGRLLDDALREAPQDVYGSLLTTLMRLVFILYAEDRGLMPAGDVYQRHYSVAGLFERLREDDARYPDTMDARYGAWAQLLALFRLIHDGGRHGALKFTARHGRLFDPDVYPFLEGRPHGTRRSKGERVAPPQIADGVILRVLRNLLILDGERLSYRALDVEQIGSVYEAMMGFALEQAHGPSVAVLPKHIVINIGELLDRTGSERAKLLREEAELKVASTDALGTARTVDGVLNALGKKVSRYTPRVLQTGALYLQPTEERRRSGSHYTPRSLTEPIVRTTFRPILDRFGGAATPKQILDLKVCDPAMGSGAFLVESCRLLAERLVKAWAIHGRTETLPSDEDELTLARRLVAERCLYGVDKNIFAVDLAKLSLWLATLAREHPFTFLDHALRHGDSLVGLSREQIACFNWEVEQQLPLIRGLIDARVSEAQRLRQEIQARAASDDVPSKAELLREADDALADVRLIGDAVVSAFFEREKPKERKALLAEYAALVRTWLNADPGMAPSRRAPLDRLAEGVRKHERPIPPFHWQIELPEVFARDSGGFDVIVGNPPFAGKNTLAASTREHYPVWLQTIHEESHGNSDLVAHFYRRAFNLLRREGAFGLIATNTIAQGDTRSTGLRWIRHHDGTIFSARKRVKWPGQAAVVVSVVHVHNGAHAGPFDLDGRPADRITAFLFHTGGDDDPTRLAENADQSFQGSIVLGMGFTFDDTDKSGVSNPIALMHELIRKNPRNAERIFPYIGGEEVNDSPTHAHHRYVINFAQMSEDECRRNWPDLMAIVEAKVKPERMKQKREVRAKYWWRYGEVAPALYDAIRGLERVLVVSRVGQVFAFTFLTHQVFSERLVVIAAESASVLSILQSRVHDVWSRLLGSTLKDDLLYTPSDCFETFPFPSGWQQSSHLERIGREYFEFRKALMVERNEGLTATYNRFHDRYETDRQILRLRELHDTMDRAVLDAYGWTDIKPACMFLLDYDDDEAAGEAQASRRRKPYRYRWPDEIRDGVLGRLLELNAERARGEELAGSQSQGRRRRSKSTASVPLLEGRS